MELLYKVKNGKLIYLDDLLEEQEKEINLDILNNFKSKYENKLLTKKIAIPCNIENIYFFYPYTLGYGYPKTNIVRYLQIAKTGSEKYCNLIFDIVKDKFSKFSKNYDAVIFVPYSVKRKINVLDFLRTYLEDNGIKIINSFQVREGNEIKNIKSLKGKVYVASKKFDIDKIGTDINRVLIIDDMVNTGASMCAIVSKLPENIKIDGLSIIGSLSNEIVSDI